MLLLFITLGYLLFLIIIIIIIDYYLDIDIVRIVYSDAAMTLICLQVKVRDEEGIRLQCPLIMSKNKIK